jgi:hypothetical protein
LLDKALRGRKTLKTFKILKNDDRALPCRLGRRRFLEMREEKRGSADRDTLSSILTPRRGVGRKKGSLGTRKTLPGTPGASGSAIGLSHSVIGFAHHAQGVLIHHPRARLKPDFDTGKYI